MYYAVRGVINGIANVMYSNTGTSYTLGVSAYIGTTYRTTTVNIHNIQIRDASNVIRRGIRCALSGFTALDARNADSDIVLSLVLGGRLPRARWISPPNPFQNGGGRMLGL